MSNPTLTNGDLKDLAWAVAQQYEDRELFDKLLEKAIRRGNSAYED